MRHQGERLIRFKIRIKYCGGCNPHYDRVKLVEEIEKYIRTNISGEITITTRDESADVGIIICGCSVCCVDREHIKDGTYQWHVVGPDMLDYRQVPITKIAATLFAVLMEEGQKT